MRASKSGIDLSSSSFWRWKTTRAVTFQRQKRLGEGKSGGKLVAAGDGGEPVGAGFGTALEGGAVDGAQAELGAVPEGPLEVVEQAPVRVAAHVESVVEAPQHAFERSLDV